MSVYDDLWAVLASAGVFMLRVDGENRWVPAARRESFTRLLGGAEILGSQTILFPVPRYAYERITVGDSAVLWVRTETSAEVDALLSWSPKPSLIFREGDTVRHTAFWALSGVLDPRWTLRLNRRLAHAIGTAKKHSDPTNFVFTPPGSKTEGGKVVRLASRDPESLLHSARDLTAGLPDPIDQRARWRQRQAA